MPNDTMPVFDEVEQKAEFEDGMYKLLEYLEKYKPKNNRFYNICRIEYCEVYNF
jgi:hypothetical protein